MTVTKEALDAARERCRPTPEQEAEMEREGTMLAPPEHTWVCGACGKTSRTRYGFNGQNGNVASRGWDESCMLNAVLCHTTKVDGKWMPVETHAQRDDAKEGK